MMSATHGERTISFRIDEELLDDFDRQIAYAKSENMIPLDTSRSEAIRLLMAKAAENPEILERC